MKEKQEGSMLRFILFVTLAWFIAKIVSAVMRSFASRQHTRPKADNNFDEAKPNAQMEFKDVKDADFVDISEQRNANAPK